MVDMETKDSHNYSYLDRYANTDKYNLSYEQIEGVDFLLHHRGCILAAQTGWGKTLCVCSAMKFILDNVANSLFIVVCPVKAVKSFRRELFSKMRYTYNDIGILSTAESQHRKCNRVFIVTDTVIGKHKDFLLKYIADNHSKVFLIVDEAHKLQSRKSKIYQTLIRFRSISLYTWLLTATPILNSLDSLYEIVNFAYPKFLSTKTLFMNTYTIWHLKDQYVRGGGKVKVRVIDGYQNLDKLSNKLQEIMLVRSIPYHVKFQDVVKSLTDKEYALYEKVSSGILSEFDNNADTDIGERNFSRRMHDLQRFVDRAYQNDSDLKDLVDEYSNISKYSTKELALLDTLKDSLQKGYNVIVYADYKDTIDRLEQVLKENTDNLGLNHIYRITGSINIKIREKVEDRLDKNDIVLITSAGTESINLQKCNCIIFYDINFSTKTMIQAIGRICRRDTKFKEQYVISIVMKGTIDEYKYRLFKNNLYLVENATGTNRSLPLNEDYLMKDSNDLRKLKNELLWVYKNDTKRKRVNKALSLYKSVFVFKDKDTNKEDLFVNIGTTYKMTVEPIDRYYKNIDLRKEKINILKYFEPTDKIYQMAMDKDNIPISILRNQYYKILDKNIDNVRKFIKMVLAYKIKDNTFHIRFVGYTILDKLFYEYSIALLDK